MTDILSTVRALKEGGVKLIPTPAPGYDALPERIKRLGIERIDEDLATLRELALPGLRRLAPVAFAPHPLGNGVAAGHLCASMLFARRVTPEDASTLTT